MNTRTRAPLIGCALFLSVVAERPAIADTGEADAAKLAQNPIASVISVPFQNNANLNVGPERDTQNVLNVQPVVPFSLSQNWNLITRTIIPVISNPAAAPGDSRTNGIGDVLFSAFLSPTHSSGWIWGVGPAIQAPTHRDEKLGNDNWGLGPTFVVLHLEKGSPWVYGVLANNVWSVSNSGSHPYKGLVQPFINYNMPKGWYLVSSPIVTVDWKARGTLLERLYAALPKDDAQLSDLRPYIATLLGSRVSVKTDDPATASYRALSRREIEILQMIADGMSNKRIAQSLGIAPETVKSCAKSIFRKLATRTRAHAVARAEAHGLL
jgi:DNA-binding CsgD family transcriptional regulator